MFSKSIIRRIKWEKVGWLAIGVMLAGGLGYGYYQDLTHPTQLVEYRKEVAEGDTLWSICASVATTKEDMGKLVWQTMQDNHIEKPGELQPGTVVTIRVKEARRL